MAASDLAQSTDVQTWLGGLPAVGARDVALLGRLITDLSGAIYAYLGRPSLLPHTVTERYDGSGRRRLYLRQFPVLSVRALLVNNVAIPAAPSPAAGAAWPQSGYLLEPWDGTPPGGIQALDVFGAWAFGQPPGAFVGGRQNVAVTYTAGYQVTGEAATVPSGSGPYTIAPQAPYGPWASDGGVTYANGTPLTPVSGAPGQGQYQINNGSYVFAAADAGGSVMISYGFIPAAINNACIEWVGERYRYRTRIGQTSENIPGVVAWAFSLTGVPDFIKVSLDPYRNVMPI